MWVRLGNEFLNLDHVVRVRVNKAWKNGQEDVQAEIETKIKGEVQVFTRYRGTEAENLRLVLAHLAKESDQVVMEHAGKFTLNSPTTNTVHDIKIPG